MLTSEIKQKIDNARNILVGKIPTPTGQVEQITLALVYKFMNDIDEQNKELGGELKFFTGEYSKYAWKNLLDKGLSAYERVTSYGEGLDKMHLNPNLPQFFRNVFRGAFLPFRDPEVLTLFLKQIDEFRYGHNGDLGDAFEYLLQVMGTQGDAGQFLTPRHIINFIVSVVDPQKTDKILDPAVGTAGFLISSYQHILKQNTLEGSNKLGSALTIDDRKRFANNFVGYDVSHDLVRLSLVNLYLHNFADPKIYEYDTLGNVDRWDDDFDCILTNPPFMTPKGGVKPHKKFSIQAKRSEVLFVDYIMEHLNPNGKAGVIVPEGIIFQSATAYKALRKMMIEQNFLYAVVSLPAGIFQPYSGVKTSILFIDRVLAKKTKDILFVKVENDGFDLGAQRKPIDKNDLPRAAEILKRYKLSIQSGEPFVLSDEDEQMASLVPIEKIGKSGDYNLSGDRYRESVVLMNRKWSMVALGEICSFEYGKSLPEKSRISGQYPVMGSNGRTGFHNEYLVEGPAIIIGRKGSSGEVVWEDENCFPIDTTYYVKVNRKILNLKWFYFILRNLGLTELSGGAGIPGLNRNDAYGIKIPLPPLEVQQELVSQLDGYQKIIDGAKQVVDNYKPEIKIEPSWERYELKHMCDFMTGGTPTSTVKEYYENGTIPWIVSGDIHRGEIFDCDGRITEKGLINSNAKYLPINSVLIALNGQGKTRGTVAILRMQNATCNQSIVSINPIDKNKLLSEYLYIQMASMYREIRNITGDKQRSGLNISLIKILNIPLPPLDIQKEIVARIEDEQQIVDANKKLIQIYQDKIKEKIDEVWGE